MTRAICSTAAAAALMVVSLGAQAAVETLTFGFEELAKDVAKTADLNAIPKKFGTPIANPTEHGFVFSGAYAYDFPTAEPASSGVLPRTTPSGSPVGNGYIANRSPTDVAGVGPITLDLGVGNYLLSLSFNVFVAGMAAPQVSFFSGAGTTPVFVSTGVPGDDSQTWSTTPGLTATEAENVNKLVFNTAGSGGGTFGLDNIEIEFFRGSGPTVPEPASYGLVALALLGAGLASRRRKA